MIIKIDVVRFIDIHNTRDKIRLSHQWNGFRATLQTQGSQQGPNAPTT